MGPIRDILKAHSRQPVSELVSLLRVDPAGTTVAMPCSPGSPAEPGFSCDPSGLGVHPPAQALRTEPGLLMEAPHPCPCGVHPRHRCRHPRHQCRHHPPIRLLIVTVGPTVAAEVRRAVSQASAGQVQVVLQGAVQLWVDMVAVASSAELRQPPCPGWPRPQLRMLSLNCCPNQAKT